MKDNTHLSGPSTHAAISHLTMQIHCYQSIGYLCWVSFQYPSYAMLDELHVLTSCINLLHRRRRRRRIIARRLFIFVSSLPQTR